MDSSTGHNHKTAIPAVQLWYIIVLSFDSVSKPHIYTIERSSQTKLSRWQTRLFNSLWVCWEPCLSSTMPSCSYPTPFSTNLRINFMHQTAWRWEKWCYQFVLIVVGRCSVNLVSFSSEPCDVSYDFSWYPTQTLPLILICSFLLSLFLASCILISWSCQDFCFKFGKYSGFSWGMFVSDHFENHTFSLHISLFYHHLQLHTLFKDWLRFVNCRSYGQFSQGATGLWGNQGVNIFASLAMSLLGAKTCLNLVFVKSVTHDIHVMYICLSVSLSFFLSVSVSFSLSLYLSVSVSVSLSLSLSLSV